ncbi:hypothetical protein PMIT1306_01869 [Prochlorococcus sp. MIT 1306]|nr:hypothetical protein PMIT1306_01869 [Prochlorococcus sp. MIT 1306]
MQKSREVKVYKFKVLALLRASLVIPFNQLVSFSPDAPRCNRPAAGPLDTSPDC